MGGDIFNVHVHMSHHMSHTILPTRSTPSHNTIITAGGSRLLTHVHMQLEPRLDVSHACAYDLPSLPHHMRRQQDMEAHVWVSLLLPWFGHLC